MPDSVFEDIDADFSDKGYMKQPIFEKWLKKFDNDMRRQRRHVALLIDSAGAHNDCEVGLSHITVIRLPPGTTSLTQPLDAGIIRSFKALYSQEMLEVVARIRMKAKSAKVSIPNAKLWPCFARAWKRVTPGCIRNCFAQVPVIDPEKKHQLYVLGIDSEAQIVRLQEELIERYKADKDVIAKQKDVGVLNYLFMNYCEGPSETTIEAIRKVMNSDKHRHRFIQHTENDIGYEGDDCNNNEDDNVSDQDYEPSESAQSSDQSPPHNQENKSPPSSPLRPECDELSAEEATEILNQFLQAEDDPALKNRSGSVH